MTFTRSFGLTLLLCSVSLLAVAQGGGAQGRDTNERGRAGETKPAASGLKIRKIAPGDKDQRLPSSVQNTTQFALCLPANLLLALDVVAGQRFVVQAKVGPPCDRNGWSLDGGAHSIGPEGIARLYNDNAVGHYYAPLGMLVGSVSKIPPSPTGSADQQTWAQIFTYPLGFPIGSIRDDVARINGTLYLICNDTFPNQGAQGSMGVTITLYPPPPQP